MPKVCAVMRAEEMNCSVQMTAAALPRCSIISPSYTLHELHDPQSPMPTSATSHSAATTSPISLRQKDRKHRECVERGRFLVRQPGDSLSFRQKCLAQDMCKGGDHERRSESSNQARITSAHDTAVSQGIVCQEEKQAA